MGDAIPADELITVIDPRHPLCGQKLRLICIVNRPYLGRCCVAWLENGVERDVPIAATDRSPEFLTFYPLPIDISSVERLLTTYAHITGQLAKGTEDGLRSSATPALTRPAASSLAVNKHPDHISTSLGGIDAGPAAAAQQHPHQGGPRPRRRRASAKLQKRGGAR